MLRIGMRERRERGRKVWMRIKIDVIGGVVLVKCRRCARRGGRIRRKV